MDIWKWVTDTQAALYEQGHNRLADLISELPHSTVDNNHTQVDAIVPEALSLARNLGHSWLEVFIRHWNLQSRLFHRHEVNDLLPEAVALLEFAHREENSDCPQSVCAVQDLAKCYALMDGPGYVEERLEVVTENFEKIDATWPCFTCLTGEYVEALYDAGRYEEILSFLDQQTKALLDADQYGKDLKSSRVAALIQLKRYDEAEQYARESEHESGGQDALMVKQLQLARIAAHQKQFDKAKELLYDFAEIAPNHSKYKDWSETALLLALQGVIPNDWHLNRAFQYMADELTHHGVIREAIAIRHKQAELAMKRGRLQTAERCCEAIEDLIPRLRIPLDAPNILEELRRTIVSELTTHPATEFSIETPEQALKEAEKHDPEGALELLILARKRWPEHEALAVFAAKAYEAVAETALSLELLSKYLTDCPDSPEAILTLGYSYLNHGFQDELQQLACSLLEQKLSQKAHLYSEWLLALLYNDQGDIDTARNHLTSIVEKDPEAQNARHFLASLERDAGNLEAALHHLDRVLTVKDDNEEAHWDRMLVGTLLKEWRKVRESAAQVGIELSTEEGPVEEEWGLCRIQITDANGAKTLYYAQRTGPVTAKVLEIAPPDTEQHFEDRLVFDPIVLNAQEEQEDAQNSKSASDAESEKRDVHQEPPVFDCFRVFAVGGYASYALDGVHPGEEALQQIKERLKTLRCQFHIRSDDEYQVYRGENEDEQPLPGIYGFIAIPQEQPLENVAKLLSETTRGYEYPITWIDILDKMNDREALERQRQIAKEYNL